MYEALPLSAPFMFFCELLYTLPLCPSAPLPLCLSAPLPSTHLPHLCAPLRSAPHPLSPLLEWILGEDFSHISWAVIQRTAKSEYGDFGTTALCKTNDTT